MDFEPTAGEREVQEAAARYARDVLAPSAERLDRVGGFPHENIAAAAQAGMLGINVPRALGGREAGPVAYSLAITELAQACAATTVALAVNNMVAEVVTAFGNADQKSEHVPKLCDGTYRVGSFALSEPGAGSDPGGMRARARRTDRGWVIDGSKLWITSATDAGLFVVWVRTSDAPGARGISAFLVRGDTPGVVPGKPEHKMGLNGSTTTALDFNEVEVGPEALLDEENRGFRIAMMALDGGRIGVGSQALGIGLAATEVARRYAVEHPVLASSEAVQWRLADSATQLDAARLLILQAAWRKRQGIEFTREASIAKAYASEKAFAATQRALEVLGELGNTRRTAAERHFRDVRVTMIYEGTSEVQRIVLARGIMRRFGDAA
jgi:alkylation response protein AidB-like acyl-CoA dehydrogenase